MACCSWRGLFRREAHTLVVPVDECHRSLAGPYFLIDALLMNRLLPIISVFLAAAAFLVVVFWLGGKSQPLPTVGSESSISSLAAQIEDYRKDLEALKD
jgi:hypothetical protein